MAPTPTLPQGLTRLLARQEATTTAATTVVVASDSNTGSSSNNGLDGGAIAGIVIGTIVGILIIWWIIKSCTKPSKPDASRQGWRPSATYVYPAAEGRRSRSRSQGRYYLSSFSSDLSFSE
ncbi:hypothetical protein N657DRAFT_637523 [Parathielavia appendiculata]|uniref:Uncharacterized protein n=1 Tax=Parathielavia appendiculata TaxID=2587402 RepID=A0AAN6YZ76_9PEZI|nr:hypothetical protein N657DRAFT_637523 [Parathielavia appendiculata]